MKMTCNPYFESQISCNCFQLSTDTLEEHAKQHIRHIIHIRHMTGFPEMTKEMLYSIAICLISPDSHIFQKVIDMSNYTLKYD
jgi:hypothetical protein